MSRHIHKGVLIRRINASHLCTAVGGRQLRKEWEKLQTRIIFERYYSFFHYGLLSLRNVSKKYSEHTKMGGGHKQLLGGHAPLDPHSDGTVLIAKKLVP